MKRIFASILLASTLFAGYSQDDAKAKAILNELSQKTKSYKTISMAFKMSTKGQDINETKSGIAKIKGNSFFVSVEDQEMYSNGSKQWTYLKDDNECYVEDVASAGDDFITPKKLLTIWEDGFKYQFEKEATVGGVVVETIKLFPLNPTKSQFHTVILNIDKNKKQIQSAIIKTKSGVTITYIVTKFETNLDIPDTIFQFEKSKHPGVVMIED